jgi:hypothetical protein
MVTLVDSIDITRNYSRHYENACENTEKIIDETIDNYSHRRVDDTVTGDDWSRIGVG